MALFNFANIEKRINTAVLGKFANISLLDADDNAVLAILDYAEYPLGEFDLSAEQRPQLTLDKTLYPNLQAGDLLSANPLQYTPDEIAAMPQSTFTLDVLEKDDALMQVWWVK